MKHGSLVNSIYSDMINTPNPVLGMDATVCGFTDRDAGKIVDIFNKGQYQYIEVDSIGYGAGGVFRRKGENERWEPCYYNPETKRYNKSNYGSVVLGISDSYRDMEF